MDSDKKTLVIFLVILSFLTGIIGGVGGIALVASSPSIQKSIGIKNTDNGLTFPQSNKVESISVKEDSAVITATKKVSPSVVSVVFSQDITIQNPLNSLYGGQSQQTQTQQGGGTGFIITSDGLIATNKHVADFDGAEYTVITQDGKKYSAKVLSKDPIYDFAVLKIDAKGLPAVDFGDSDSLDIGQRVIAIGNALGEFQNTVTVGVLSGKDRTIVAEGSTEPLYGLLQTDAAINEGNSGGPLLNLKGQVIGITTATAAKSQAEGLGFAIPISSLKTAIDSIKKTGKIVRPYLGIRYVKVDQKIVAMRGLKDEKGILVIGDDTQGLSAVVKDSPADKAGLKSGDVILKINNDELTADKSLNQILAKYQANDEVTLKILRGSDEKDVKLKLGEVSS